MKPFESFMASQLEEYIIYRQSLGYQDIKLRGLLRHFDLYIKDRGAKLDIFNPAFFLEFRQTIKVQPRTVNNIFCAVNGFFQFLVRQGICEENPLQDLPPKTEPAYLPFIFSPEETEQLLNALQKRIRRTPEYFLKDMAIYIAIVLLARCGLRISEPLGLLWSHYRFFERTLYIEKTKFKKDRLIPLPKSVVTEIENYLSVRKSLLRKDQSPYLLIDGRQKRIISEDIYPVFHQGVRDIGLDESKRVMPTITFASATPHSLRHSFAVNTLKRIRENGKSPQAALPVLAAYMGHLKYHYTAVYLKVIDAQQRKGLVNFTRCYRKQL